MDGILEFVKSMRENSESEDEADENNHQDQKRAEAARLAREAAHLDSDRILVSNLQGGEREKERVRIGGGG
jgi:hypothetical protein